MAISPYVAPAPVAAVVPAKGGNGKGPSKGAKGKGNVKSKTPGSGGIEPSRAAYVGTGEHVVTIFAYSAPYVSILSQLVVGSAVRFLDLQGRNNNSYGALFVKSNTTMDVVDSAAVPPVHYTDHTFESWDTLTQYANMAIVSLALHVQSVETKHAASGDPYLELWGADIAGARVGALRLWRFNGACLCLLCVLYCLVHFIRYSYSHGYCRCSV